MGRLLERANLARLTKACASPTSLAVGLSTGWYLYLGYGATFPFTHITWMLRYDWTAALWGFSFHRNAPWSFPLGSAPDLFYPFGTSTGFTDACPWMALLFKLLSPLLPLDFQYFGLWFWLCYALQAVVGTRVARVFSDDPVQQTLGGCLFALTPLIPARHAHAALSGLFFVTAGVYLHLRPVRDAVDARRLMLAALALLAWAAGTHGYLSVMSLALVLGFFARLTWVEHVLSVRALPFVSAVAVGVTLLVYYLFGYIGWKTTDLTAEGFGDFSADLLTLIDPREWSRWIAAQPTMPRQWEGFGYLGVGVLALLSLRVVLFVRAPRAALRAVGRRWPLVVVLVLCTIYALSSRVSLRGQTVWNLEPLYRHVSTLTGIFRSSGRFVWPLHLTLLAAALSAAAALPRRVLARGALCLATLAQAGELNRAPLLFDPIPLHPLADPVWTSIGAHYRHLALVPVHILWVCRYDAFVVNRLAYEAYRRKLTFNSGNFMRMEPGIAGQCERGLEPGEVLDPATIYVIDPAFRAAFVARHAVCGVVDGLLICVSPENASPLREVLRRASS